jgi:hypothetical protein
MGDPDVIEYLDFYPGLAAAAFDICVDFLRNNDIDKNQAGNQYCSELSAISLCDEYVQDPALDALGEIPSIPGGALPLYESTQVGVFTDCPEHFPELGTEGVGDDGGACTEDADGGGDGADTTTGSGGGNVFGDLSSLIDCSPQTTCSFDTRLLFNVQANWETFYDDGVTLTMVTITGVGSGVEIEGLSGDSEKGADLLRRREAV